jgi:hypothetical protein
MDDESYILSMPPDRNGKQERLKKVNELVKVIGSCGRRFFYYPPKDRYAALEIDGRGRIWWVDDYTQKRIYTHYRYDWRGFSHGGTMRSLVICFRDFITKGKCVRNAFGPWPDWYCDGDLWGYGEAMKTVRAEAQRLGIASVG